MPGHARGAGLRGNLRPAMRRYGVDQALRMEGVVLKRLKFFELRSAGGESGMIPHDYGVWK